jgi:hypothetical protein
VGLVYPLETTNFRKEYRQDLLIGTRPRLALLASYLLQPAATPVTRYGKHGRVGHSNRHGWGICFQAAREPAPPLPLCQCGIRRCRRIGTMRRTLGDYRHQEERIFYGSPPGSRRKYVSDETSFRSGEGLIPIHNPINTG